MSNIAREIRIASFPVHVVSAGNFKIVETALSAPAAFGSLVTGGDTAKLLAPLAG
jgi:hypothetical protein